MTRLKYRSTEIFRTCTTVPSLPDYLYKNLFDFYSIFPGHCLPFTTLHRTSFFIVYRDFEKKQELINDEKHEETKCTGDRIRKILGLEFCASVFYPKLGEVEGVPAFPLTGPAGVSVVMNKRDVPNGYKVEAKTIKVLVLL